MELDRELAVLAPLLVMILALIVDGYLGDPPWLSRAIPGPRRLSMGVAHWLERKLNRDRRGERARFLRGGLAMLTLALGAGAVGFVLSAALADQPVLWAVHGLVLLAFVSQRAPLDRAATVSKSLRRNDPATARTALRPLVNRDIGELDAYGVARAAAEGAARRLCDSVVAPLFWYAVGGLPMLLVYGVMDAANARIGGVPGLPPGFGWAARRIDAILKLIPARLAGLMVAAAALFTPGGRPWRSARTMVREAHKMTPQSAAWPIAAVAGALDLSLAGPRRYSGHAVPGAWVGSGRARMSASDLSRCVTLLSVACMINALIVCVLVWIRAGGLEAHL